MRQILATSEFGREPVPAYFQQTDRAPRKTIREAADQVDKYLHIFAYLLQISRDSSTMHAQTRLDTTVADTREQRYRLGPRTLASCAMAAKFHWQPKCS
jgi:hypothetical protein